MKQASSQTRDKRLQFLAGATAALSAVNAVDAIAQNPATAGGVNVSIAVGYYDLRNNLRVITNSQTGLVVTVIPGAPKK